MDDDDSFEDINDDDIDDRMDTEEGVQTEENIKGKLNSKIATPRLKIPVAQVT